MTVKRFVVEAGHIALFARAIGDSNPVYSDEAYAAKSVIGHLIAPPTFIQASEHFDPDYDRRPREGEAWFGSGREAIGSTAGPQPGEGRSGFHAEQHFEYHRTLRPGDVVHAEVREGRSWKKQGRRGGTLMFRETITEYRDAEGELVITARFIDVLTEREVGSAEDASAS